MPKTLLIIRGVQGSGKTTLAKMYTREGYLHYEADMFFVDKDGVYRWDANRIVHAHQWCQDMVRRALSGGNVVVSNTFVKLKEMEPYLEIAKRQEAVVQEIICWGNFQNEHNVPQEKVNEKRQAFQLRQDLGAPYVKPEPISLGKS